MVTLALISLFDTVLPVTKDISYLHIFMSGMSWKNLNQGCGKAESCDLVLSAREYFKRLKNCFLNCSLQTSKPIDDRLQT
jgi:hypothetical protein